MEPPIPPDHHFVPGDPDVRGLHDPYEERFDGRFAEEPAFFEERAPSVQQRFDRMTLDDDPEEIRPRADRIRSADTVPTLQDYLYYRLSKRGDDWSSCVKKPINAPVDEIERKARRGKGGDGPVLEQLTRMPTLRRSMLDEVVRKANSQEAGDALWEVVYIKSKKVQNRKGRMEVPEMDVILARTRDRSRSRAKSFGGEKVRKVETVREKRYINDSYGGRVRKDSVLDKLEDPVANLPLFEADGTPRDDLGPMHFNNANLPPYIARETPLGSKPEKKKEKSEKKRSKSRSKSRDRGAVPDEDGVYVVPEVQDFATDAVDPAPVDAVFVESPTDRRGRRGLSPQEHPVVVVEGDARRSHSRHRMQPETRSKSRRRESVHFPNQHTQQYFDAGYASSENSDTSHYGFVADYAESSNTSLSTPGGVPRRGSLVYSQGRPDVVYKKHHPGPSRRQSYVERPYHGEQQVVVPAIPRRNSYVVYDQRPSETRHERHPRLMRQATAPIPEDRQIVARDLPRRSKEQDFVPIRRYTTHESAMPIVHYHHTEDERDVFYRDELDRQSIRVEDYQRDRVLEDHLSRREQQLTARERDLDLREDELRQAKRRSELTGERDFYDDRDFRRERRETRKLYYDARTGEHFFYND